MVRSSLVRRLLLQSLPFTTSVQHLQTEQGASGLVEQSNWVQAPVENLEEIRARIFGNRIGNGERSGAKRLRKKLIGPVVASYYPEDIRKRDPFLIDTKAEA